MGKYTSGGVDKVAVLLTGTFAATGQSSSAAFCGPFNLSLWGTFSATAQLERSFDGGSTWIAAARDSAGNAAAYSTAISLVCSEPELGVLYRLNCTAYTSGTINYRVSQ